VLQFLYQEIGLKTYQNKSVAVDAQLRTHVNLKRKARFDFGSAGKRFE
jgi:hypothetical protein